MEELINDSEESFRRGFWLSTQAQKLAKARAETVNIRAQMEQAQAEAARARQEARELREHILASSAKQTQIPFRTVAATFTAILLLTALAKVAYLSYIRPGYIRPGYIRPGYTRPAPPVRRAVVPFFRSPAPTSSVPVPHIFTHKPLSPGDLQFKRAMRRLQEDLGSFTEDETETVREVNQHYPHGPRPCPLEWVNHEAALSLDGDERLIPPSLTTAVTTCASAIEKWRDQKDVSTRQ